MYVGEPKAPIGGRRIHRLKKKKQRLSPSCKTQPRGRYVESLKGEVTFEEEAKYWKRMWEKQNEERAIRIV